MIQQLAELAFTEQAHNAGRARILLRAIERCLRQHSPDSSAAARLGAVVFIHRFGSALNAHLHFSFGRFA